MRKTLNNSLFMMAVFSACYGAQVPEDTQALSHKSGVRETAVSSPGRDPSIQDQHVSIPGDAEMTAPLMPKATASWLLDNTTLTFDQIAEVCGLHPLEVQVLADGETFVVGVDPVATEQLSMEESVSGRGYSAADILEGETGYAFVNRKKDPEDLQKDLGDQKKEEGNTVNPGSYSKDKGVVFMSKGVKLRF